MREHPFDRSEPKWLYRDLNRAHEQATSAVFSEFGIRNLGQPLLLFVLDKKSKKGEYPTQRELATELNLSPSTITMSIKSLEKHGCIRKLPDDADMRKNRIEITERGKEVSMLCHEAFDRVDEAMYLGFTAEEIALISSFYIRMRENLMSLTSESNHPQKEDPS